MDVLRCWIGRERRRTVEVLEVGELDSLAHAEHVSSRAKTIDQHPRISRIERAHGISALLAPTMCRQCMLDIAPRSDDGRKNDQSEGEERHRRDGPAEPEDFPVGDQDDG